MELDMGKAIAEEVIRRLSPYCSKIQVAGSIRRQKPIVRDVDIVLIPSDLWNLNSEIMRLGLPRVAGGKLRRVIFKGVQVDLYLATPEIWATLLLIRTGSVQNNICLCSLAKKKGCHLAASGDGLFNKYGQRIAGDTESSIYEALGLPYQEPWERR